MIIQAAVEQAVRALCPILGISFGNLSDKASWRIRFVPSASEDERHAAREILATPASSAEEIAAAHLAVGTLKDATVEEREAAAQTLNADGPALALLETARAIATNEIAKPQERDAAQALVDAAEALEVAKVAAKNLLDDVAALDHAKRVLAAPTEADHVAAQAVLDAVTATPEEQKAARAAIDAFDIQAPLPRDLDEVDLILANPAKMAKLKAALGMK